jgi:hypothetical protein
MRENRFGGPLASGALVICVAISQSACTSLLGDFDEQGAAEKGDAATPGTDGGSTEGTESGADGASMNVAGDGAPSGVVGDGGTSGDAAMMAGSCSDGSSGVACPAYCPLPGKATATIDDGSEPGPAASILAECGRAGAWYTDHDPTSSQTPDDGLPVPLSTANPPPGASGYVETYGVLSNSGLSGPYGASISFDLARSSGVSQDYDALSRGYSGITFWVRITQPVNVQPYILLQVLDAQTAPTNNGEFFHQYQLPTPQPNTWTQFSVPWSQLHQTMMTEASLDLTTLRTVSWQFNETSPGSNTPQPFDVSIGGVAFLP